ncbi:MAG: response regulator [Anaerolineae bacterium]|nr:response regulator [Anaerolineae bacterium]
MKTPLVLIVEDSPTQARQISANLAKHGIRSLVAGDGPEGLRAVDEQKPDLIVLDINLPTMDGYQVCRRLKRDPNTASIPVIMLTEFDGSGATMRGLEAGADDYIPKDVFAVENLMATLEAFGLVAGGGE